VTIQLPIYNEPLRDRAAGGRDFAFWTIRGELLEIQVLDESTDQTQQIARDCVERHQAMGVRVVYLHRTNREGYKAGALAEGLKKATGEFIRYFDADFLQSRLSAAHPAVF